MMQKLSQAQVNARVKMFYEAAQHLETSIKCFPNNYDKYEKEQARIVEKAIEKAAKRFLRQMEGTAVGRPRT